MKKNSSIFTVIIQILCIITLIFVYSAPHPHPLQGMNAIFNDVKIGITKTPFYVGTANGTVICSANNNQSAPHTCSDGAGGVIITWQDPRSGTDDIYVQRVNATGHPLWVANGTPICTASSFQNKPRICSDGEGGAIITWRDSRSGWDIYAQRINSIGSTLWAGNGVPICTVGNTQSDPKICSDGAGGAIITWYDWRSAADEDIYAQRINATGAVLWTVGGVAICNASSTQILPEICSDGLGGAIITWSDFRSFSSMDVYAQRIDSTGVIRWTDDGTAISSGSGEQMLPAICSDGVGGAILAWVDSRSGSSYDVYAQRINANGSMLWVADGTAICTAITNEYHFPKICSDGTGGAIITWQDGRSGGGWDIYAQRILAGGSVRWATNGTVICTETNNQQNPQICSDGAGGAIITWQDGRSGGGWDIYAQIIDSTGIIQWTANGTAISTAVNNQEGAQICTDGIGGSFITWKDLRTGMADIYTFRIRCAEGVKWTNNGTVICTASNDQEVSQTCSDGTGGAIITWRDNRSGGGYDIYAQQINATGHPLWAGNGTPICTTSNNQINPQICSDGVGGAIITWQDFRSGSFCDVYAQRVNATGHPLWAGNGTPIFTGSGGQINPQICSDGVGGAIIAWEDVDAMFSIFAQRINATGHILWVSYGVEVLHLSPDLSGTQICSDGAGGAIITSQDDKIGAGYDIYAQRILAGGSVRWVATGIMICDAVNNQINPRICSDGAGGAIITWQDDRSGAGYNIYAQQIDSIGIFLWAANGTVICTAANSQVDPQICSDGVGGAIITWTDARTGGGNDIYADRVREMELPKIIVQSSSGECYNSPPTMDVDFTNVHFLDSGYYQVDSYLPSGFNTTGWTAIFTSLGWNSYTTDFTMESLIWDALSEGTHTVYFKTWDDMGLLNENTLNSWQFYKDTVPPESFSIVSPAGWTLNKTPTVICQFYANVSGVNVSRVQFAYSTNGSLNPTNWAAVDGVYRDINCTTSATDGDTGILYARVLAVPFNQDSGTSNTIRFRATDMVGNLGSQPTATAIQIDSTPPDSFSIVSPAGWTADKTPTVTCQFYTGLSGVNISTVQYAYSIIWETTPTNWAAVDGVYLNATCTTPASNGATGWLYARVLAVPFNQESEVLNTIRFRAIDMVGNMGIQSTAVSIQIDATEPWSFSIIFPTGKMSNQTPTVICQFYTGLSGVNLSTVQYAYSTSGASFPTNWAATDGVYTDPYCTIPISQNSTGWLYIKVDAVPFNQISETLNTIRFRASNLAGLTGTQPYATIIEIGPTTAVTEEPASILLELVIIIGTSAIAAAIIVHALMVRSKSPKPPPPPPKKKKRKSSN